MNEDVELAELLKRITEEDDPIASVPTVGAALTKPTDAARPERAEVAKIVTEGGIDFHPDFASFGARFVGFVIDTAILLVAMTPGIVLVAVGSTPLLLAGLVLMAAAFCVVTALYARSVAASGQWIGNRVMSTKVVDVHNGRTVPVGSAATRFVIRTLVSTILLLGFIVAFFNADRRAFHDNFAGTVVTRPARERWSIDDEVAGG